MNIKKEVFRQLSQYLLKEYEATRYKIRQNKYQFKKLSEEQTVLKRKLVELNDLYNYCKKRQGLE
jgi:hypothetical protein